MKQLEYKGYIGQFIYDEERELFEGTVANIEDRIVFHAKSVESLNFAFKDSINDYLSWCKRIGKEPENHFPCLRAKCKLYPTLNRILGAFRGYSDTE